MILFALSEMCLIFVSLQLQSILTHRRPIRRRRHHFCHISVSSACDLMTLERPIQPSGYELMYDSTQSRDLVTLTF